MHLLEQLHLVKLKSKHQLVVNLQLQVVVRLHYEEVEPRLSVLKEQVVQQLERVANLLLAELFAIE